MGQCAVPMLGLSVCRFTVSAKILASGIDASSQDLAPSSLGQIADRILAQDQIKLSNPISQPFGFVRNYYR